jgi:hypothetical protein
MSEEHRNFEKQMEELEGSERDLGKKRQEVRENEMKRLEDKPYSELTVLEIQFLRQSGRWNGMF